MNFTGLNLGQIISKLEQMDETDTVILDFCGFYPTNQLCSYRGYYEDLAIIVINNSLRDAPKVKHFLSVLKGEVGKVEAGYKGGEYKMDENTSVWVTTGASMSSPTVIRDIIPDSYGRTVILTGYEE